MCARSYRREAKQISSQFKERFWRDSMTIEEAHKQEMTEYIKSAIEYLEMAMNVVECDDKFNNGQSKELNIIYDKANNSIKSLENI